MMRSLYSGVAGLKTHQTKMDVIGNNIANVNTTAFKSSSITFSDLMSQTTANASGANAATGTGGVNAKQIGLGVKSGAISMAIATQGSAQSTGNPFDIMITGDNFFVVNNGQGNYFTRDGSFYVDGAGNLAMTSTGYNVMGWGVDENTGLVRQDNVTALRIMSAANMTYPPEPTTKAVMTGILDKNDTDVNSIAGKTVNLNFYDKLGYSYTARMSVHSTATPGEYNIKLDDILDSTGTSMVKKLNLGDISDIAKFGSTQSSTSYAVMETVSGYEYDNTLTPKAFKHVLGVSDAFNDYDKTKIPGVTYEFADTTTPAATGSKVQATGKGTVTKADLQNIYHLTFENNTYWQKDDVTGTGSTVGATDWAGILGLTGVTNPVVDADGNLTFEVTQEFTVGANSISIKDGVMSTELDATVNANLLEAYGITDAGNGVNYAFEISPEGTAQVTRTEVTTGNLLKFDSDTGKFISIGGANSVLIDFAATANDKTGQVLSLENFSDVDMDFTDTSMFNNNGTSTLTSTSGDKDGVGSGRSMGDMIGVSVQNNGMIYASYDNGMTKLLGQIATASFANPSGLQKEGDNIYSSTMNSGEFDGIGVDITANGGYMSTGTLEMSNVDLSAQFTDMITTQRGFQANSRIITVSDTLLEELTNLKR